MKPCVGSKCVFGGKRIKSPSTFLQKCTESMSKQKAALEKLLVAPVYKNAILTAEKGNLFFL